MKTLHLVLILALAALVNCTEKGKPVIQHEGDTRRGEPSTATQVDPQDEVKPVSTDLKTLAEKVLSAERMRDLRSYGSRQVHDELLALNAILLRQPDLATLKNYVTLLELECGDIKASCLGLKYFRIAGSSAEVVKMAAVMPEFEAKAARLLLFAVDLKNGLTDNSLLKLLIEKVPPTNESVRSMLETALLRSNENLRESAQVREFLISINAWELVAGRRWMLGSSAQTALWSMIGRARLMHNPDGKPSPEFTALYASLNEDPASLAAAQKKLLDQKQLIPQALGAQPVTRLDELNFLADAVFTQKLPAQAAAQLFLTSGRKPQELLDTVENYVRMRFVIGMADANVAAKDIFNAAVPTEQLLMHAIRQSSQVKQIWGTLNTQLTLVKNFATKALQLAPGGAELEPKLRSTFNSFGRSVNLSSVYPHTLLLFQMLSQKRFRIYLRGFGDVDTGNLMPMIYYGNIPPLLTYSEEQAALNHFEILHAFDMAVRSRLFATMGIDVDEFMADVLSRLNQYPGVHIEETLNRIDKRFEETRMAGTFESICAELKGAAPAPRELDLSGLRVSPYLGPLVNLAFTGMSSKGSKGGGEGKLQEFELGVFYADGEYSESLERARLDITQYERVANAMLVSYRDYLRKFENVSDAEFSKRTEKTRAKIEAMSRLRERAVKSSQTLWERIGWCYSKAAVKDYETVAAVIQAEENHLRSIYRDMQRLRAGNLSEADRVQIQSSHQFSGLPSDFKGADRFDKDVYSMSSIDFLIRTGFAVKRIYPNIRLNFGSKLDMDVVHVRSATIRQVPFTDTEEKFVESGLRAIFTRIEPFVTWQSLAGGRINIWQNLMKTMFTGYRLESERGEPKVFTPERIMELHEDMIKMTRLSTEDRHLLNVIHEPNRFDPLYLNDRLMIYQLDLNSGKYALQDIWSLFDMPVIFSTYEKLGYDYDFNHMGPEQIPAVYRPKRYGFLELGRLYYGARSVWNRGTPMVPYNPVLDQHLDARVNVAVREGIRASKVFQAAAIKYIDAVAARPSQERPRADINVNQSITNLLSDNLIPSFQSDLSLFRQATQGCFEQRCADFK